VHFIEFIGRVFLAVLFLIEGLQKTAIQEDVITYMESHGVPEVFYLPALIIEILIPLLLVVGYKVKFSASIMALFTFTVAIIFHTDFSGEMQSLFFLKDLAIAGGFLIIVAHGPGNISLDYYLQKEELDYTKDMFQG